MGTRVSRTLLTVATTKLDNDDARATNGSIDDLRQRQRERNNKGEHPDPRPQSQPENTKLKRRRVIQWLTQLG
ncbi:hypothetical protein V6N13_043377 [Hibiscus sabdariffa]